MKGFNHFQIYFFVAVVIISSAISAIVPSSISAQNNTFGIKDETFTYYQKCLNSIQDSIVLTMLDTLFQMSQDDGDLRMQTVTLSTRMDYYFFKGERDSFLVNVDRTKTFAKEHGQSKHYYFAWGRLITFNINNHFLQTALYEAEKMQEEALKDNDKYALLQSYQTLGRIYNAWGNNKESAEYFLKATNVLDENIENDRQYYNFLYTTAALEFKVAELFEESEKAAIKSTKYRVSRFDTLNTYRTFASLYTAWGKPKLAKQYLDTLKQIGYPTLNRDVFLTTEMQYYALIGDYQKALETCDELLIECKTRNSVSYLSFRAHYLEQLGFYKEANAEYSKFYDYRDSINKLQLSQELSEQAVLLNLNQVQAEKTALELKMRTRWLYFAIIAFIVTAAALLIFLFQFYKIKVLNKKNKKSEQIKTIFLQNLSHEVRTPLNSIMGFSDIIHTTHGLEEEEYNKYSKVIYDNSKQLLKLFNEALEASEVQTVKEKRLVNINEICKGIIEQERGSCHGEVKLIFNPCEEDSNIMVDKNSISKVVENILKNSIENTSKGSITINTQYLSKNRFMITITDTGSGSPIYHISDTEDGIGLGLSLSRVIADSIKGSISIDNSYTDGCRTNFVFPV